MKFAIIKDQLKYWLVLVCAILASAFLMSTYANAQEVSREFVQEKPAIIGLHIATKHDRVGFCEFNPGLYIEARNGVTAGIYKNSECNTSVYAGYTFETRPYGPVRLGLMLGGVLGYNSFPIAPMVLPSVAFDLSGDRNKGTAVRLTYLPKFGRMGSRAVHVGIEKRF